MTLPTVTEGEKERAGVDDAQLMVAVQAGDPGAFRILVERYKKKAYYLALKLVGDRNDAYDLSQEAFIRVYNARRRYDHTRPFYSWFYAILSNLAKNHLKRRYVRSEYAALLRKSADADMDARSTPDERICAEETRAAVWSAIEKLSYEHREVIILRHFEDMAYEDIARLLGIPAGSVMSRLYYARKKLRELLGEAYEG
jgi:RNA polymerase sigma-70 factor (ECF subfamily)